MKCANAGTHNPAGGLAKRRLHRPSNEHDSPSAVEWQIAEQNKRVGRDRVEATHRKLLGPPRAAMRLQLSGRQCQECFWSTGGGRQQACLVRGTAPQVGATCEAATQTSGGNARPTIGDMAWSVSECESRSLLFVLFVFVYVTCMSCSDLFTGQDASGCSCWPPASNARRHHPYSSGPSSSSEGTPVIAASSGSKRTALVAPRTRRRPPAMWWFMRAGGCARVRLAHALISGPLHGDTTS